MLVRTIGKVVHSLRTRGPAETASLIGGYLGAFLHPESYFIDRRRASVSERLSGELNGTVRYGPLQGFELWDDAGRGLTDKASILLGLYEREVLEAVTKRKGSRDVLVNIGAADGYYGVGLVRTGYFSRSVCYEISPSWQAVIERVARKNGVSDRVKILGAADAQFVDQIVNEGVDPGRCVVLCDIEGGEFDILTRANLRALRHAVVIVEIHDFIVANGAARYARLKELASEWFSITEMRTGARDLSEFVELERYSDTDRWLICSEGRGQLMTWLVLDPKDGAASIQD